MRAVSHLGSDMFAECCTRPQYVPRLNCETGRSRLPGSEDVMLTECEGVGTAIEAKQASTARGFAKMSVCVGKCVGRDDIGDNAKRELATSAIAAIGTFHPWVCHFYISGSKSSLCIMTSARMRAISLQIITRSPPMLPPVYAKLEHYENTRFYASDPIHPISHPSLSTPHFFFLFFFPFSDAEVPNISSKVLLGS